MANPQCEFTKPDGTRCGAYAVSQSQFCFNHDPTSTEAKKAAVAKGGDATRRPALSPFKLENYRDIRAAVETLLCEVRERKVSASEANTLLRLLRWESELILGLPPKHLL